MVGAWRGGRAEECGKRRKGRYATGFGGRFFVSVRAIFEIRFSAGCNAVSMDESSTLIGRIAGRATDGQGGGGRVLCGRKRAGGGGRCARQGTSSARISSLPSALPEKSSCRPRNLLLPAFQRSFSSQRFIREGLDHHEVHATFWP